MIMSKRKKSKANKMRKIAEIEADAQLEWIKKYGNREPTYIG